MIDTHVHYMQDQMTCFRALCRESIPRVEVHVEEKFARVPVMKRRFRCQIIEADANSYTLRVRPLQVFPMKSPALAEFRVHCKPDTGGCMVLVRELAPGLNRWKLDSVVRMSQKLYKPIPGGRAYLGKLKVFVEGREVCNAASSTFLQDYRDALLAEISTQIHEGLTPIATH